MELSPVNTVGTISCGVWRSPPRHRPDKRPNYKRRRLPKYVLVMFTFMQLGLDLMARSNAAQRRPPVRSCPPRRRAPMMTTPRELLGVVVEHERRRGRGAAEQCVGALRVAGAGRIRRWLADTGRAAAVQDHRHRATPHGRSLPATTRPILASTARSIPIAAVSTAASIVLHRPTHAYLGAVARS